MRRLSTAPAALLIAALTVGGLSSAAARSADEAAVRHFQRAESALAEGNSRTASIELRNALQRDPNYFEARVAFGRLLLTQNDPGGALRELRRADSLGRSDALSLALGEALGRSGQFDDALEALASPSDNPDIHIEKTLVRGNILLGLGRNQEAAAAFDAVLRARPDAEKAQLGAARAAMLAGAPDQARSRLAQILERDPKSGPAYVLMGELEMSAGRPNAAIAQLSRAVALSPDDADIYAARARAHLAVQNLTAARADAERVRDAAPNSPMGGYLLAAVAFSQGDLEAANAEYTRIARQFENFGPSVLLGALIKFNRGEHTQADQLLSQYIRMAPDDPMPLAALGSLRLRMGQPRRAVMSLRQALELDSKNAETWRLMAEAQTALEDYDAAADAHRKVAELGDPADASRAAGALALLTGDGAARLFVDRPAMGRGAARAMALLAGQRYEDAGEVAAELLTANGPSPALLNIAAAAAAGQGDRDEARGLLNQALSLEPEFLPALTQLDALDRADGRQDEIAPRLQALIAAKPDSAILIVRRARMMVSEGRRTDAEQTLAAAVRRLPQSLALSEALVRARILKGESEGAANEASRLASLPGVTSQGARFAISVMADAKAWDLARISARRLVGEIAPDSPESHVMLVEILTAANDRRGAERALRTSQRRWPANRGLARAAVELAIRAEDRQAALVAAEKIRSHDSVAADRLSAGALLKLGDAAGAVGRLERAARSAPDNAEIAIDLFSARLRAGRRDAAVTDMRVFATERPQDRRAQTALGTALMGLGDYAGAAEAYRRLLSLDPNNPIALNNYAWARHELGEPDALDYAARAFNVAGGAPEVADTYGWLLIKGGRMADGVTVLRAAAAAAPDNGDILYHLAYALAETGRRDAAAAALDQALENPRQFASRQEAETMRRRLR